MNCITHLKNILNTVEKLPHVFDIDSWFMSMIAEHSTHMMYQIQEDVMQMIFYDNKIDFKKCCDDTFIDVFGSFAGSRNTIDIRRWLLYSDINSKCLLEQLCGVCKEHEKRSLYILQRMKLLHLFERNDVFENQMLHSSLKMWNATDRCPRNHKANKRIFNFLVEWSPESLKAFDKDEGLNLVQYVLTGCSISFALPEYPMRTIKLVIGASLRQYPDDIGLLLDRGGDQTFYCPIEIATMENMRYGVKNEKLGWEVIEECLEEVNYVVNQRRHPRTLLQPFMTAAIGTTNIELSYYLLRKNPSNLMTYELYDSKKASKKRKR